MTKIKLCGLTRTADILVSNELLPNFVGFVFYAKSKRYITPQKAVELKKLLDKKISAVGVFVNEKIEMVAEIAKNSIADFILLDSGAGTGNIFNWQL